jgi:ribosomal protein S18 acetylase RimI-like enzyme
MIRYSNDKSIIDQLDIFGFFVGWPSPPNEDTLKKLLKNSQHIQLAIIDNKLIGFVNALSDLTLTAYIPLLEVLPEYKGQGIGTQLIKNIQADLNDFYMIDICCDEDVIPFYKKLGFTQGHSMSSRNYQMQNGIK